MGEEPDGRQEPQGTQDYRFSDQIGYLLRRAYQRHLAIFQANASDPHLTAVQFSTLCALRDRGAQSQGALVKSTGVDQATIRGIVDRLKWRGFISLSKDRHDGRKVIIDITPAGRETLERMIPCAARISELTMQDLNPAERMALLYTLRRISGTEEAE
ncbi:MarR family winged helix-turn-helix transcriptional regulator [Aureimonas populi]|uniref:MarR family winged helix-turn-helix transcriptional regulator n=1 Tax=Aureimonas populi TaxID=1701758 RepID=A0ABW5CL52_9HYPH|nr:MarR family winged helix-turn-helix transcriptional regulator [Aureimonas populi]